MREKIRIDLPLLLPEVPDERDACVGRLRALLERQDGIARVHVVTENGDLKACVHYDPEVLPLAQVERVAKRAGARISEQFGHSILNLRAIDGEDAAKRIEKGLLSVEGVISASVNLAAQKARVEFDRHRVSMEAIERAVRELGYDQIPRPTGEKTAEPLRPAERAGWYARNKELTWSLFAGVLLLVAWLGHRWFSLSAPVAIALYLTSYGFGGFDLLRHTLGTLKRGRFTFDIDLLMLLAAVGAAVLGEWAEGAFLLFLFSLAHALEHYALDRARGAIRALAELAPPQARLIRDGREREVPVEQVRPGDAVVVRPAERIPVDGKVRSGHSAIDQAPITGESVPVEKGPDDEVFAGTINGSGAVEIIATRAVGDRTLDRVMKLVEEAQTQKAPTQQFTERFERIFVPAVLIADLLLIIVPPLLGVWWWGASFYRGMALLVAASPCALALGTPSAVLAGIAQAARKGVLIKGGAHLENLGSLKAMALDKTGTLTVGRPEVTDLVPLDGIDKTQLLRVAAAVERRSQHPLAQAVVRRAASEQIELPEAEELESVTGRGVRSSVGGQLVEIGSLRLWDEGSVPVPPTVREAVAALQRRGRSTMAVRYADRWLGVLGVADEPRPDVRAVLDRLRTLGIAPLVMLTGDNRGVGESIGREVGVDEVRAELMPEDKVAAVRELLHAHGQVAMVGDGVNDAPALANATVGIAMGGAGTAVALETADVALMADDLGRLPFAVKLSRTAKSIIRQNLILSLLVIALLIIATITGFVGIGPAVIVHEGSTLVVIANSLRLLGIEERSKRSSDA